MKLSTFPIINELQDLRRYVPPYMRPNLIPMAVVAESFATPAECQIIIDELTPIDWYEHEGCGARTRESQHVPALDLVREFALSMNQQFWKYDLDMETMNWMQSYPVGGNYQLHMDSAPGQMRKLTAVIQLTDETAYDGGELEVHSTPLKLSVPRARGTIVVFQPWLLHEVLPVTRGLRQTVNMGFWGPPFR